MAERLCRRRPYRVWRRHTDRSETVVPRPSVRLGLDLVAALQERGLLELYQHHRTAPVPFRRPPNTYVGSFHARSGFSRDRMDPAVSAEFDEAVRAIMAPYGDPVELQIMATVDWGKAHAEEPVAERRACPTLGYFQLSS